MIDPQKLTDIRGVNAMIRGDTAPRSTATAWRFVKRHGLTAYRPIPGRTLFDRDEVLRAIAASAVRASA